MICRKCNSIVPDDSVFCPFCGQRISSLEDINAKGLSTAFGKNGQNEDSFKHVEFSIDNQNSIMTTLQKETNNRSQDRNIRSISTATTYGEDNEIKDQKVEKVHSTYLGVLIATSVFQILVGVYNFVGVLSLASKISGVGNYLLRYETAMFLSIVCLIVVPIVQTVSGVLGIINRDKPEKMKTNIKITVTQIILYFLALMFSTTYDQDLSSLVTVFNVIWFIIVPTLYIWSCIKVREKR